MGGWGVICFEKGNVNKDKQASRKSAGRIVVPDKPRKESDLDVDKMTIRILGKLVHHRVDNVVNLEEESVLLLEPFYTRRFCTLFQTD